MSGDSAGALAAEIVACRACPRLVAWQRKVAREKRAAFASHDYWGRPVPGFGDPAAWLLVVGLAPAAHGANRTGRMFTGDRSGDWLYSALHTAGLANRARSTSRDDGLQLNGVYITAAVRCAPPANQPTAAERDRCLPYLGREIDLLTGMRVIVALGGFAFHSLLRLLRSRGAFVPKPTPRFAHGCELTVDDGRWLLGSYHPSQQNTFTGTLTREMFADIWRRAIELGLPHSRVNTADTTSRRSDRSPAAG